MATIREMLEARNELALENPSSIGEIEKIITQKRREKKSMPHKKRRAKQEARKSYMSRKDREEFMLLAAMAGKLGEIIENWDEHNRPRERIKWAKSSLTFLYKAMGDCMKGIPPETIAQVVREVGLCTIGVIEYEPRRR